MTIIQEKPDLRQRNQVLADRLSQVLGERIAADYDSKSVNGISFTVRQGNVYALAKCPVCYGAQPEILVYSAADILAAVAAGLRKCQSCERRGAKSLDEKVADWRRAG
ncbi:MAG: hypothetical protein KGL39_05595 [Patescibacteria group bacterium]|nr:hypothetical protein [Patescibacteria group bacterium]